MREMLGPRTLTYVAPDGREGEIVLTMTPRPNLQVDLGGGCFLEEVAGSIEVVSDWFTKKFEVHGIDDLQLIFRMLWFSDIYIQKICRDNGYELQKYIPGDVDGEFGIYK